MSASKQPEDNLWVSLADLKLICKRSKRLIFLCMGVGIVLGAFYSLTTPVEYLSTASFREKNGQMTAAPSGFASILLGGTRNSHYSEAITTMQSRKLLEELVKQFHLQGVISKHETHYPKMSNLWNNAWLTVVQARNKPGVLFPDKQQSLGIQNIEFLGEAPLSFRIIFLDEHAFQLYTSRKGPPIEGRLGVPVTVSNATFTVVRKAPVSVAEQEFGIGINTMTNVVNHLSHKIGVEIDREDKTLLKLKYLDTNRHQAAAVLNGLMDLYQEHLKREQQRISSEQIGYLEQRQNEVKDRLQNMMEEHAAVLTADVKNIGFPDVSSAIAFFAAAQQEHTRELLNIDLELKHLQKVQQVGVLSHAHDAPHDGAATINPIVSRMRMLRQQADSIELSLAENPPNAVAENTKMRFDELNRVQRLGQEALLMIASVQAHRPPDTSLTIYQDPQYKVKSWCEQLQSTEGNPSKRGACETQFVAYLGNLQHQFHVHENALQEQLTNQRDVKQEFQGIDLDTTKELYLGYSREINNLEAEAAQKQFIINQIQDPAFEISSLSTVLTDPVSQKMISTASGLLLSLKDEDNRSAREQERLRNELSVQKGFLSEHLHQTIQLLELRQKLLKDKISALQVTTLGLIRQEHSVLEKHLTDNIAARVEQLEQKRSVIEQHQQDLQGEMLKLPEKWVSEKLINQQMELNGRMVEEITKLVESKNTSSSLDLVQSAPVDQAIPPLQPKSPRALFFIFLGGTLGAFLAASFAFTRSVATGFPVTAENLRLSGQNVSGKLTHNDSTETIADTDLEALRHLVVFLETVPRVSSTKGQTVGLILERDGPDYSRNLAMLLTKKGNRVLLIPLAFDQPATRSGNGLLQYLEGTIERPDILKEGICDLIPTGGITRFGHELIGSVRFQNLIKELQSQYDWILIAVAVSVKSAEAAGICQMAASTIITITDQTWDDIRSCLLRASESSPKKNVSFIITKKT